jgi:hypothetical protein
VPLFCAFGAILVPATFDPANRLVQCVAPTSTRANLTVSLTLRAGETVVHYNRLSFTFLDSSDARLSANEYPLSAAMCQRFSAELQCDDR